MDMSKAFVTGSYAYGVPGPDSDVDLVVLVTQADLDRLVAAVKQERHPQDQNYLIAGGTSLRFGMLNLICCTNKAYYDVWLEGTKKLKKQAPVSRDFAVNFMARLRNKAGFSVPADHAIQWGKHEEDDIPF